MLDIAGLRLPSQATLFVCAKRQERIGLRVIATELRPASAPKAAGQAMEWRPRFVPLAHWGRFSSGIQAQDR